MRAFNIEFDDEMDSLGEGCVVLALDMTEALVIAHSILDELNKILREFRQGEIRIKAIEEMSEVIAPELGFSAEKWLERLRKAMAVEEDDESPSDD